MSGTTHSQQRRTPDLFVDFFIQRPVFATVCALFIDLRWSDLHSHVPIAELPDLRHRKSSSAAATLGEPQTVETAVTIPLEQGHQRRARHEVHQLDEAQ